MTYTFDENIVSDLHKDARGFRPTEYFWEEWTQMPDQFKQKIWDSLCQELEETMDRERRAEADAMIALHQRIQGAMLLGAKDEVQALKWIMEAEEFDDCDLRYGPSYFCYHFGLSYSAANELPIQEAINEMQSEVV
jgi:predicted Fe-S protein YdhL (DUF1289 family)